MRGAKERGRRVDFQRLSRARRHVLCVRRIGQLNHRLLYNAALPILDDLLPWATQTHHLAQCVVIVLHVPFTI